MENPSETVKYCYSAPAKFILSGEHSVVYNKDALVATIDMRTYSDCFISFDKPKELDHLVDIKLKQAQKEFKLTLEGVIDIIAGLKYEWEHIQDFHQKFQSPILKVIPGFEEKDIVTDERLHFFYALVHSLRYVITLRPEYAESIPKLAEFLKIVDFKMSIDSELPIAKGVGSSASYAVVIAASMLKFWETVFRGFFSQEKEFKAIFEDFEEFKGHVNQIAFDFEKIFHSTPSGLDNSAITYGGILIYNKGEQRRTQVDINFLETFEIVLIDSGLEKNTKKTVEMIRNMTQNENLSQATVSIINTIGDTTKSIAKLLTNKIEAGQDTSAQRKSFEQLIKMNHCLLKALNLTNSKIDKIIEICEKHHFSAKLTGGGDGGYCVCFIPKEVEEQKVSSFLSELKQEGFETNKLRFAKYGLIHEEKNHIAEF